MDTHSTCLQKRYYPRKGWYQKKPLHIVEVAFFDTIPFWDNTFFAGMWSVYPYFDSGTLIASSITEGLFVLQAHLPANSSTYSNSEVVPDDFVLSAAHPNPFNIQTEFLLTLSTPQHLHVAVYDLQGREVKQLYEGHLVTGQHSFQFEGVDVPSGMYMIRATGEKAFVQKRCCW